MSNQSLADFVWETIGRAEFCADQDRLEDLIACAFRRLGADAFVGVELYDTCEGPQIEVCFGQSPPTWPAPYAKAGHPIYRRVMQHVRSSADLAYWSDLAAMGARSHREQPVSDEMRASGLTEGLTVPLHHPGGRVSAVLLIGGALDRSDMEQRRAALLLSHAFSLAARRLGRGAARPALSTPRLTPQESLVLYWVRRGESDKSTGQRMSLSPNTVAAYLRSAARKLGVKGRGAAAQRAADLGLLPAFFDSPACSGGAPLR